MIKLVKEGEFPNDTFKTGVVNYIFAEAMCLFGISPSISYDELSLPESGIRDIIKNSQHEHKNDR